MSGHICPECGTDRGAASEDGRPGCGCAERAAEDFHPLRIRPYVTLHGPQAHERAVPPYPAHDASAAMTMPLGVLSGPEDDATTSTAQSAYLDGTGTDGAADAGAADDLYEFGSRPGRSPRRREQRTGPALWLAVGAAVVAVVGVAAFTGGLFSGSEEREFALPDMPTSAPAPSDAPEASAAEASATKASASGAASRSPGPSASVSAASASASGPVAEADSAARSADASAGALPGSEPITAASSTAPSTAPSADAVQQSPEPAGAVLSKGDRGPEVAELQDRLAQAQFYNGPGHGQFNDRVEQAVRDYQASHGIQGDPEGTYGPHTRRALEAETREP
ncbi:peptidoglycan-binding protein [Streptomyces sp. ISL-99]|uniref:peptidoglycan-binding domain-containing protein n=1 Tax=Streptomyces sp. ISL-99 TaxID=2819193 RepID=UPI001BECD66F|nr:peptidoglycan-binding domain-containing protein [Streptomyces sp. ISL-99]MBT2530121.1 peptidoglycan-binding protein [Streptomyces sp. ISL-99]